jgi:hypothetical protein
MENETEVDVQEEVVEQEEQQQEEVVVESEEESSDEDDSVTLSKAEFNKLNRRAKAYIATKETKPEETKLSTKPTYSEEKFDRMELRVDGYSTDEVDEIMALGGPKVLKSKLVQSAIKAMRDEKKSKDAEVNVSAKSPVFKKYTQQDLSNMSAKELEKILPKA